MLLGERQASDRLGFASRLYRSKVRADPTEHASFVQENRILFAVFEEKEITLSTREIGFAASRGWTSVCRFQLDRCPGMKGIGEAKR